MTVLGAQVASGATTFTRDTVNTAQNTAFDGQHIVVSNRTVTVDGLRTFAGLKVLDGGGISRKNFCQRRIRSGRWLRGWCGRRDLADRGKVDGGRPDHRHRRRWQRVRVTCQGRWRWRTNCGLFGTNLFFGLMNAAGGGGFETGGAGTVFAGTLNRAGGLIVANIWGRTGTHTTSALTGMGAFVHSSRMMKSPLLLLLTLGTTAILGFSAEGESWTTLQVGKRPESITKGFNGLYYVTVMGAEEPGDAVVKVIKGDRVEVFATGMDEPKGIAFTGNYLVTTDLKRVWKIDAQGCASVLATESAFPHAVSYLNDAAPGGRGRSRSVFITDMGARDKIMGPEGLWPLESAEARALPAIGRIYEVFLDGKVKEVVGNTAEMACPNGVCVGNRNRLLIAEFFHGNLLESAKGKLRVLNTGFRGGDGIVQDRRGNIYLSSWTQGKVWKLDRDGKNPKVILEGLQSAADFYLDEKAGVLLVPDMKAGTVTKVSVGE